ncbi:flagella basal body P-ring formation protein FlgA [Solimonas sp. K1W22B-7]|uniref:flagellar basal body P-ring formation chaperone FlgA n=1 Tax=Solimonas sp. K1W22B-7 TaxID=2303331 RepID=UPI000E32F124|nr:flagellar basal body P-ring formation chaperone FlgA [Solimonas sp. K1W22B-7]AXQ28052.1 flagella basal body P-ring formation protein FlgA [Solimonas sp. K1W22B-7]
MPLSRTLLTIAVLALVGLQPAASSAAPGMDAFASCPEESGQMRHVTAQVREMFSEASRICALNAIPADACDGAVAAIDVQPLGAVAQGRLAVAAGLRCDDGSQRRLPLWFRVEAPQRTAVALHALRSGALVVPEDFEWTERMAPVSGAALSPDGWNAGSRRLARPLRAGDVLLAADLRAVSAVESGTTVQAALAQGGVRMRFDAVAMGDGASGDRIRVKSRRGGRSLPARVTGNNTVELLP